MNREALNQLRDRIREYYLLEQAERHLAALTDSQRTNVRAYYDAAERRLAVARDLRSPQETPAAVTLYRQGGLLLALAILAAKEPKSGLEGLAPQSILDKLRAALVEGGAQEPAHLEPIQRVLLSSDPLESDRLAAEEASNRADELDEAMRWMTSLVDARSPGELKRSRILRLATTIAAFVVCVVVLIAWATAPKNVARGKPAAASSVMFSTNPSGIVDGSKSGTYGFHSGEEAEAWASIDLGAKYALTKVAVYGRGDGHSELSIPLAFEISDDGTSYRQVTTRTAQFSESDPWVIEPASVEARFVRLRKLAHGYLVLSEVEVFGKKAKPTH